MRNIEFQRWLGKLERLSPTQRQQLQQQLEHGDPRQAMAHLLQQWRPLSDCPHCRQPQLHPWGSSDGLARYRCRHCGKTCNALTGTPLARLRHREQWLRFAQTLIDGLSVRAAAAQCQLDKNTAWRWRQRFLRVTAEHRAAHASGIVEADETFFLQSFKGQRQLPRPARRRGGVAAQRGLGAEQIPVLVVRDRSGQTADFQLPRLDARHIAAVLRPLVDADAILCTDGASVYVSFAKACGIQHRAITLHRRVEGVFHIQNVNAYDSRLKNWMRRFHGVATRYLPNYLGWRRMLERYRAGITPQHCLGEALGLQQLMPT